MKLRTAIVLAIFAMVGNAAELTVDHGVFAAGRPVNLNVRLASGSGALAGVQFDVEYDTSAMEVTVEAGQGATGAGKNLSTSVVQPGKRRVLIVGFNQNALPDGVVAILHVTMKGQVEAGKVLPIKVTVPSGTTAKGQPVEVSAKDGSVTAESRRNQQ